VYNSVLFVYETCSLSSDDVEIGSGVLYNVRCENELLLRNVLFS